MYKGKRPAAIGKSTSNKRVKFDAKNPATLDKEEEYDPLEADIATGTARKKDVKLDGYASDSSEEGHGLKRAPNIDNETGPMDEDDDMFGAPPSKEASRDVKDKEKAQTKYLDLNDIQGQDFSTKSEFMDIVDESEEDDEDVDEEVGALGKKHNAPKMDSFNMREELEEGKFDEDGNYIRTAKDQKDNQDDWLKDVSRKDIQAAREAVERKRQEELRIVDTEDTTPVHELIRALIPYLDRGETLLEALARLAPNRKKPRRRKEKSVPHEHSAQIERMTELANRLMARSQIEVYDTPREGLIRAYSRESGKEYKEEKDDMMTDNTQWEFVWEGKEDEVNGPYDEEIMKAWLAAGQLRSEHSVAMVRRLGEITFVKVDQDVFDVL